MLKNISNLGTVLSKTNQKEVNGGMGCEPFQPCSGVEYTWSYTYCACVLDRPNP